MLRRCSGKAQRNSALQDRLDGQVKDWTRYAAQAAEIHLKNAGRAGAAARAELAAQVDPGFTLEPDAVVTASQGRPPITRTG